MLQMLSTDHLNEYTICIIIITLALTKMQITKSTIFFLYLRL